jgi:NTE family protein
LNCDAVFEGGGVKGIAFVGAIQETERRGFSFNQIAGTSAGSITASLLAAGYSGEELEELMDELSFLHFLNINWVGKIPIIGKVINVLVKDGIYNGRKIEEWIEDKLQMKGIKTFGDLPEGKLKIIASDLTNGRILIIPDDLHRYNIEWKTFSVAKAVRMSSSIPYFFQPYIIKCGESFEDESKKSNKRKKNYIVDGVLLSNFPVWIFDSSSIPRWPTFGYRLRGSNTGKPSSIKGPITMLLAIFTTMMEAHDRQYVEQNHAARTIFLPVEDVKATDFGITDQQKKKLIELGREAAKRFFDSWDFTFYIRSNRNPQVYSRQYKIKS